MSNPIKSALWSALWTFVALFGVTVLGFLTQVAQWAGANGRNPFPDTSILGYAAISAVVAAVSGLVTLVVRAGQANNVLPGAPPVFPTNTPTA